MGTTEAATLLRYWGLRARIADFGVASEELAQLRAFAAISGAHSSADPIGRTSRGASSRGGTVALELHPSVACNGCGAAPIAGARWKSEARQDYDLCQVGGGPTAIAVGYALDCWDGGMARPRVRHSIIVPLFADLTSLGLL